MFSLIREIQNPQKIPQTGIKYQEYTIQLEENSYQGIGIPLKECPIFEQTISDKDYISKRVLKELLRQHRGIMLENKDNNQ